MRRTLKPPRLRPGATIGIAALSGAVDISRLEAGERYLCSRGYAVVEAPNLRLCEGAFAGSDRERAEGYMTLVRDPSIAAIFFARGGWGASRAIPHLDAKEIASFAKIHLGASDLTALFAWLQKHAGLVTFHGPMVAVDFARERISPETDGGWEPVLSGRAPLEFAIEPDQVLASGAARGLLTGGCLSLLVSLEGTPEAVSTRGKILFWEDVHEELYRLDRMLTQWKRAGRFEEPAGVIIGALENITRNGAPDPPALEALLRDFFADAPYPVIRDWPAGHGRRNRTMPLSATVSIDTPAGTVVYEEPGVA
jgi:muramoyltetrapeptide carboxypeptidase